MPGSLGLIDQRIYSVEMVLPVVAGGEGVAVVSPFDTAWDPWAVHYQGHSASFWVSAFLNECLGGGLCSGLL